MLASFGDQPLEVFKNNKVFVYLSEKKSPYEQFLTELYTVCSNRLNWVTQYFPNYTMHDIGHVVRVADYMTDFVEDKMDEISDIHLAMILCAGLMHDVGMIPFGNEDKQFISDAMNNEGKTQAQAELDFQNYVRKNHAARVEKVFNERPFDTLFADFKGSKVVEDLSKICRSHTEEIDWMLNNIELEHSFRSGSYNPQQIALLLKLGDNLDFDGRRAPEYMAKTLEITGFSKSEWDKHTPVVNYEKVIRIARGEYIIKFEGNTDDTCVFRNTLKHIRWLEKEAERISKISKKYQDKYAFEIQKLQNDVTANGYKSSKLEFQLDYNKVLNLLMGEHIYSSKKDGLRELLQNAIDAVMVMNEKLSSDPMSSYNPMIIVEMDREKDELRIKDNGIGMTKDILKSYFFKIGESYYSSDDFKSKKGKYNPIGHFGIGFMSCFMLSDVVKLETKAPKGPDLVYEFDKDCDFTIEKTDTNDDTGISDHGTWVTLEYGKVFPEVFADEDDLIKYIRKLVITDNFNLYVKPSDGELTKIGRPVNLHKDLLEISNDSFDVKYSISGEPLCISSIQDLNDHKGFTNIIFCDNDEELFEFEDASYALLSDIVTGAMEFELEYESDDPNVTSYDIKELIKYLHNNKQIFLADTIKLLKTYLKVKKIESDVLEEELLKLLFENDGFELVTYPIIVDAGALDFYLKVKDSFAGKKFRVNGTTKIDNSYFDFTYFSILKRKDLEIPRGKFFDMVTYVVDNSEVENKAEYDSAKDYPFEPVNLGNEVWHIGEDGYWIAEKNVDVLRRVPAVRIYMNGILVREERPIFPYLLQGTEFDYLEVNVKSREYTLNVARSRFDDESRKKIGSNVIAMIYDDLLEQKNTAKENTDSPMSDVVEKFKEKIIL
ncbi:HD domain-containing protein [Pseudobutyrivibrio sp. 49]|nr:HD domain-containing protein [Pseudobutyrivibrio sp. 49]SFN59717.1 HD domain-containing protein [Pseudobutyrivibrio sp. UC1225]